MEDKQYVKSILQKSIFLMMQFECNKKCTPGSVIKLVCDVNIGSIQDDGVYDSMCVGSLIICCKPNCTVAFSIAFPSRLSWQYQFFDLQLTQFGIDYFDTSFSSLIPGFQ